MVTASLARVTVDDLLKVGGKAELIGGSIIRFAASGFTPSQVAGEICSALRSHARATSRGFAAPDGLGFTVLELRSGRESFCPDASYHVGPRRRGGCGMVVWDVDPEAEVVRCHRGSGAVLTVFRRGQLADAEPAVPGWTMAVDAIFG